MFSYKITFLWSEYYGCLLFYGIIIVDREIVFVAMMEILSVYEVKI